MDRVRTLERHAPVRRPTGRSPAASREVPQRVWLAPEQLGPAEVLALQRSAGNAAVAQALVRAKPAPARTVTVQRGKRWKAMKGKIAKERARKTWKKDRKWPEQQLKGRLLERMDKYAFRSSKRGYIDMNKLKANFPAIDGIANGKFRQVKAYLSIGDDRALAKRNAIARIVAQAVDLEDKSEKAARDLVKHKGRLLRVLLEIDQGLRSTAGRTGTAPYDEVSTTEKARARHAGVLPGGFRTEATKQLAAADANKKFEFDDDALSQAILADMVVVVPSELVSKVRSGIRAEGLKTMQVEGADGITSEKLKGWMDKTGFTPSKRGGEDDDPDYVG